MHGPRRLKQLILKEKRKNMKKQVLDSLLTVRNIQRVVSGRQSGLERSWPGVVNMTIELTE